ncbi:unnamed protein product [Knipowitschia caucasica]|uniref:Uncharacterized protein n=2 Tax=Knipowitschia caucasica TaxID=637954 RepID=A0AAV2JRI2_KNICA
MKTCLVFLSICMALCSARASPLSGKAPLRLRLGGQREESPVCRLGRRQCLAHGLLQLGQGLKEHVDKTRVQVRDIGGKIKGLNRTVVELGKESQKLQQEGEALKARARGLEEREGRILNVSVELREEVQQERRRTAERVTRLEQKVEGLAQGERNGVDAKSTQMMLEAQNKRIDDLMERIRLQQEKLDKQNVRIRTLQTQIQQSRQRVEAPRNDKRSAVMEQSDSPWPVSTKTLHPRVRV